MFIFGDKTSNKSWYYEGPEETPKIANATITGSINTSDIDKFRQGVEITQQKHWCDGIGKIHAGETDHVLRKNAFGQDDPRINDEPALGTSWYKDIEYFDPIAYVRAQELGEYDYLTNLTFPIVTSDNDQIENYVFNGVIEPISIRAVSSFFSIYVNGYEPTGIRGAVMCGNDDIRHATDSIVHVHELDVRSNARPFLDMIDMIGNTPTTVYFDQSIPAMLPYVDCETREKTLSNILRSNNDISSASLGLQFGTESYIPSGSVSPTSGFIFDNNTLGTDSIAFGGMTY